MRRYFFCLALSLLSTAASAQTTQESYGPCSPNIFTNNAPIKISCTVIKYTDRGVTKELKLVVVDLPSNNEDERNTKEIINFFDQLQGLDGEIIYLRFATYVGAGFGFNDVPKNRPIRAGAIFDVQENYDLLDGFGGRR